MARKSKDRKKAKRKKPRDGVAATQEHVLDRLYFLINTRKDHDPESSYTARLFTRGRAQIAKKLGEEAVEAVIQGTRGDGPQLVGESADLLYHLLTLWSAMKVKPKTVWAELARREGLPTAKKASPTK
jgi:phosphoribosyl-ATP pyrophosphohydrolase